MTPKKSPVWPPFPGCGYEGAYEPVIAQQMVAEQQTPEGRKAIGRKTGSLTARANAERRRKAAA